MLCKNILFLQNICTIIFPEGGEQMVKLRILEILEEQGHTKYWLYKRMDMMSYRNFKNIIDNETSSIRFELLDRLSRILEVPVGDLFIQTDNEDQE